LSQWDLDGAPAASTFDAFTAYITHLLTTFQVVLCATQITMFCSLLKQTKFQQCFNPFLLYGTSTRWLTEVSLFVTVMSGTSYEQPVRRSCLKRLLMYVLCIIHNFAHYVFCLNFSTSGNNVID